MTTTNKLRIQTITIKPNINYIIISYNNDKILENINFTLGRCPLDDEMLLNDVVIKLKSTTNHGGQYFIYSYTTASSAAASSTYVALHYHSLVKIMNHLQIAVDVNDQAWKHRLNERMDKLKQHNQDASSQPRFVPDEKIMTLKLYEAVDNGDVDRFVDLLEQISIDKGLTLSAIFDQVNQAGDSLLHVATDLGREQIAELISHHFPSLLVKGSTIGDTALHVAAASKNSNIIKVILSIYAVEKSNFETKDEEKMITRLRNEYGDTALHEAVNSRHLCAVTELLLADEYVAHYLNKSGKSPLYFSVLIGDMEILDLLLQVPFPESLPLFRGNSPLHAAILNQNLAMLKEILVKRPELIYFRDEDGGTPLHYASYIGYVEGVRILLETTTQISLERNKKGHLPIHMACKKGHVEVVKELLQQEWPNPKVLLNHKGQNILHVAAKAGENDVLNYLLRNRNIGSVAINGKDVNGNTPLHLAARNLFIENLYSLSRDKRIYVELINNDGLTPLDIIMLTSKNPPTYREYLSCKILYSAGVPHSEKVSSMVRYPKQELKAEWVKEQFNILMVVSILMTTVTFAAGFTLPGGVISSDDQDPKKIGMAVLVHKPMFQLFTICNTIAMYSSTAVCIVVMWTPSNDFHSAVSAKRFALRMLGVALVTTGVAFLAAVRLVVNEVSWLANVITIIGSIFLLMIVLSYTILTFRLRFDQPILRDVSDLLLRIRIWYARTSTKVITKKGVNSNSKHVDKVKQEGFS